MTALLAYRPFLDSLHGLIPGINQVWLLFAIPLTIAICIVYKATKVKDLRDLPWQAAKMTLQVLVVMTLAAIGVYALYWAAIHYL